MRIITIILLFLTLAASAFAQEWRLPDPEFEPGQTGTSAAQGNMESAEMTLTIPTDFLYLALWFLFLFSIVWGGQVYFNEESRKKLVEATPKDSLFPQPHLLFLTHLPVEAFRIMAILATPFWLGLAALLLVSRTSLVLSLQSNMLLLASSLALQILLLLFIIKRRRTTGARGNVRGFHKAFYVVTITGPPEIYFKILIVVFCLLHLIVAAKILFT